LRASCGGFSFFVWRNQENEIKCKMYVQKERKDERRCKMWNGMRDKKMRRNQILLLMVTGDGGGMMDLRWRIRKM